jgi:dUTP pyrophosphatase
MKIYYFSDSNFSDMKEKFESSFKDEFDKQHYFLSNLNIDRSKPGCGVDIWKFKTQMIIDNIKENSDEIIIISDIDIIFHKPVIPIILDSMFDNEICFQKENSNHGINIGFICIYCNENTLKFWEKVYEILCNSNRWDQEIVNHLLYYDKYNIKWNLFPSSIWNWSQGDLNKDIALHHANCVILKEDKFKQMKYVDEFINGKNIEENVQIPPITTMKLLVKKLAENAQLPRYGSDYAAGMDLMSNVDMDVPPQSRRLVGTGISVSWEGDETAKNYYLRIAPRSGLSVKNNIDIGAGVVDYDYRGEIFVCFINNSLDATYSIKAGERIAQMILTRIERFSYVSIVESHEETERGEGGFGSTGK